jgi:hypothetical protein
MVVVVGKGVGFLGLRGPASLHGTASIIESVGERGLKLTGFLLEDGMNMWSAPHDAAGYPAVPKIQSGSRIGALGYCTRHSGALGVVPEQDRGIRQGLGTDRRDVNLNSRSPGVV